MSEESGVMVYSLEEKFRACVDIIQNLPKKGPVPTTYVEMLTMYALFKQATLGPCDMDQPGFWNVVERYKWDAWSKLGELSSEEAMERYVAAVIDKVDYCAEQWDWDEMLKKYATDFDKLEPILREKFRVIGRELIKADGSREDPRMQSGSATISHEADNERSEEFADDTRPLELNIPPVADGPNDPLSDAEYCDAKDDHASLSRSSSFSLHEEQFSPSRVRSLKAYCARMDMELRTISTALIQLSRQMEARHNSLFKLIKNSAVYIAVPSKLSWRAILFFLVWPLLVHWLIKWMGITAF